MPSSPVCSRPRSRSGFCLFSSLCVLALSLFLASCGGGGSGTGHPLTGNTSVTLLVTSTSNDQLSQFAINLTSLTLMSQSGEPVSLISASQQLEFMHLNGRMESLLTVTVPQGVYTSATAAGGASNFTCVTLNPTGAVDISSFANAANDPPAVTVNLAGPITITGDAMALSLDLMVSQSATYPSTCYINGIEPYSLTPTFELTAVTLSSASSPGVEEAGLDGEVSAVAEGGTTFSLVLYDGQTLTPIVNAATVYQRVSGIASLSVGSFVDMDAELQSDGSLLATRVAVEDTNNENLSVQNGPLLLSSSAEPTILALTQENQGCLTVNRLSSIDPYFSYGSAEFQVSGQYANLEDLPFPTTLTGATIFPGQNLYVTTHATTPMIGPTYLPATTITLMPQTINGVVEGSSTDGSFTTYIVSLAAYDPLTTLAVQGGQTTVIQNPSSVVVYVDSNTRMQNTEPLAAGSTLRFTGLLFDDGGTMRMDCGQVLDGVPE